jgi:type I protein arginine methyltransferase
MYSLRNYTWMSADPIRVGAYLDAMRAAIRPGDVVLDLGTGSGFFAVAACRLGAGRVYAIDPNPALVVGAELARANGCADRIEFIEGFSTGAQIDRADVIVSDIRGVTPLHGSSIPTIVDARERLLRPGGIILPTSDTLFLALIDSETAYKDHLSLDHPKFLDIDLAPVRRRLSNTMTRRYFESCDMLSAPSAWASIDYRTVTSPSFSTETDLIAERSGVAHGVAVWFDTDLYQGHGFSNSPASARVLYGQLFLPFPNPIELAAGEQLRVSLRATHTGNDYVWQWSGGVLGPESRDHFAQSTFRGEPFSTGVLRKRAPTFTPRLTEDGRVREWILSRMDGTATLAEIATEAHARFPEMFPTYARALGYAGEVAHEFGA